MKPPERFFEMLSEEAQHAVPLNYRFVPPPPHAAQRPVPTVESRPYRSKRYACAPFHKPISRCFDLSHDD